MSQEPTPTPTKDPAPEPTPDPTPTPDPAPDPAADPPAGDPPANEPEAKTYDEVYVKKLRDEAAANRVKAKEAEQRAEAAESKNLSDDERTQREAEQAREKANALEARVKRSEVRAAAASKEIGNPDLAADLIDLSRVELNEDGEITNGDELLDALLVKYPDLKAREKEEQRPDSLKQVLKDGDVPAPEGEILSPEAARRLLDTNPEKFNELFDKGLIKKVASE